MKNINLTIVVVLALLTTALTTKAQTENLTEHERYKLKNPTKTKVAITPAYTSDTDVDGVIIDYRVFKHYTLDDIKEMTKSKKEQVNYLYSSSFEINQNYCNVKKKDIDVYEYNQFRTLNEDASVYYVVNSNCKLLITLDSWNKIEEAKAKISLKNK